MSECDLTWRILEAEPSELQATADTELALHLIGCETCRHAADRVLAANAALDRVLSAAPGPDAKGLIARARVGLVDGGGAVHGGDGAGTGDGADEGGPAGDESGGAPSKTAELPERPGPWRRPWVPIVAAASGAALLVPTQGERPLPGTPISPRPVAPPALVEAQAGQSVAVMQTDDPDITVLWFFQEEVDDEG